MVISPNDFSLWSRLTGNKYPSTPRERAQKGPEVQRFIQNLGREGMLEGKQEEEQKKKRSLPEKLATGALIAGGVAAGVAAARDKRVQDVAQRVGSTVRDRTQEFLKNLGPGQEVDVDIVDASGDVTPDPDLQRENQYWSSPAGQQEILENEAQTAFINSPEGKDMARREEYNQQMGIDYNYLNEVEAWKDNYIKQRNSEINKTTSIPTTSATVDNFKPVVGGETFGTSGAISRLEDIGDAKLRAERTYEPMINALQQKNPGINLGGMKRQMLKNAEKDRDFDIAYMVARGQGKDDAESVMIARQAAGFSGGTPKEPTEYRKFLGEQKTGSIIKAKIDDLINMVQPGQIARVEGVDQSNLDKYGTWQNNVQVSTNNATPDNKMLKPGAEIGGTTLVDQQATKMAVDNALDNARAKTLVGPYQAAPIKGVTSTGLKTSIQDDNLRRMEPTPEAVRRLTAPKIEEGVSGGGPGGGNGFGSSNDPNSPAGRLDRLEQSIAETKAISENLGRYGELLSQSSTGKYLPGLPGSITRLVPGTTRFDSARAAGYTTASGVTPRITNPRFQDKGTLGKTMENVMPKAGRLFFEQDSEGNIIPETLEIRGDRREIIGDPKGGGGRKRGETAGPPKSPLDTLIAQAQRGNQGITRTRPVFEEIDNTSNRSFVNPVQSGGLEQSPPDFGAPSVSGRSIGKYGIELGDQPRAKEFQVPTESPSSFTQAPGRAKGPVDIVVSGGRANNNKFDTRTGGGYEGFKSEMDNIIGQMGIPASKTINIVSGGASGVDSYAAQYANEKREQGANFTSEIMEADWSKGGTLPSAAPGQKPIPDKPGQPGNYDPAAGGVRNQKMINKAEAAIVFDGGSGTEDFTRRAEREQTTRRFPVYNASETGVPKTRFAGESFDTARELQKIQTNQSVSPEQRRINAKNFLKNLETDTILQSIDYS